MGTEKANTVISIHSNRLNQSGMSLTEVLIAIGMVGILTMVLASVIETMQKSDKQTKVTSNLQLMKQNIEKILQDGRAWNETISDPDPDSSGTPGVKGSDPLNKAVPELNCLAMRTPCPHVTPPALPPGTTFATVGNNYFDAAPFINVPVLSDASGARFIDMSNPATGFTEQGSPCTAFVAPPASGNNDCPIRWELKVMYTCPAPATTCLDPGVRAIAIVYYNPKLDNPSRTVVNETRFRVDVTRGARGENRSERFEVTQQLDTQGSGGGPCTPNAWTNIGFNFIDDPTVPVPNATLPGDGSVMVVAGTYTCSAQTTCYACGALGLRVWNQTAGPISATQPALAIAPSALAPAGILANAKVDSFTFTAQANTRLRLQHFCQNHPYFSDQDYGMGMALPDYAEPTKFSTLTCTRIF